MTPSPPSFPPWGGEFLINLLPLIDWERLHSLPPKWILGYSDTSTLTFTYTLNTGVASAHGTNYCDLSAPRWDALTRRWTDVLGTEVGGSVVQKSSEKYQSSWNRAFQNPGTGFYLDTPTEWKVLGKGDSATLSGRLLGGCVETLSRLVGTPFAPVHSFVEGWAEPGILWYLESAESSPSEIYRALWTLRENGWFRYAAGVLFGRPGASRYTEEFSWVDALEAAFAPLDVGHLRCGYWAHAPSAYPC